MQWKDFSDAMMDEILGGAGGAKPNDAQAATAAIKAWADDLVEFFNTIFQFFADLGKYIKF